MKRLLLLAVLVAAPGVAFGQTLSWSPPSPFPPSDSLKIAGGNGGHGIAVDPDGKVWMQPFGGTRVITFADSVYSYSATAPVKRLTMTVNEIYVYNPDGTPAPFSPILYLANATGTRVDTLGFYRRGSRGGGTNGISGRQLPVYDTRSGRGMRRGADGNIYAAQFNTVFRFNYRTGALMGAAKNVYGIDGAMTAPAVDGAGNVYTATVVAGVGPIKIYAQDLASVIDPSAVAAPTGFSRSFEVNQAGTRIYWSGYTTHAIHIYKRNSDLDPFIQTPDTVLKGFDSESLTIHPVTKHLWASAGSPNDAPNRYPNFRAPYTYQSQTWYSFDQAALTAATPNPAPRDSIKWNPRFTSSAGRPRGIDFTQAGTTAYATAFSQPAPAFRKFVQALGAAVPTEASASGLTVRAFPNPARGAATVEFGVAAPGRVNVTMYDALGRAVATLVDEHLVSGTYRAGFDATGLPSGTYLYRVTAGGRTASGTLVLLQ